jgi:hypothetical protein
MFLSQSVNWQIITISMCATDHALYGSLPAQVFADGQETAWPSLPRHYICSSAVRFGCGLPALRAPHRYVGLYDQLLQRAVAFNFCAPVVRL